MPIPWIPPQTSQGDTEKGKRGGDDHKEMITERKGCINENNLMSWIDALVFKEEGFLPYDDS